MSRRGGNPADLVKLRGLRLLLQISGIEELTVIFSDYVKDAKSTEEREALVEVLQVLKEPSVLNR